MSKQLLVLAGLAAGLFVGACDSPLEPLPEGPPESFEFSVSGFFIGSKTWTLRGDTMVHYNFSFDSHGLPTDSVKRIPTIDEWRAFWAAADRSGIRRWQQRYLAEGIIDGTGWTLEIHNADFEIRSEGGNAYPDSRGREHEGESTQAFRDFRAALDQLSGSSP